MSALTPEFGYSITSSPDFPHPHRLENAFVFPTLIIEMRYFGGMTAEETAEALDLSAHIVRHDLRLAQAWLRRNLAH